MRYLLATLLALPLEAQLSLSIRVGSTETPVGPTLDFGRVAQGDAKDISIRLRNLSTSLPLSVTTATTVGGNFRISSRPSLPITIGVSGTLDIIVRFDAGPPASYSGLLRINTTEVTLLGVAVTPPNLNVTAGCALASAPLPNAGALDFGRIESGTVRTCALSVSNSATQPLTIATLRVTGAGFTGLSDVRLPFTLAPGESYAFSINFTATSPGLFSGVLTLETRTYSLAVAVFPPNLPAVQFETDRPSPQSGQQVRLTLRLAAPSPIAATGFLNLAFTPDNPSIASDPAVVFVANGARTLPVTIRAGETQVLLNGQASATLQTGTTAGRIVLTVTAVSQTITGDPTFRLTIPADAVNYDSVLATRLPEGLTLRVIGFDNTYSAGQMTFRFFDRAGGAMGSSINADFSREFTAFFARNSAGSAFRMFLNFPVSGNTNQVGAIEMEMRNTSGKIAATRVSLP